jgi:glycosyltransferase involved in cell wall biosynthesis|tara:strand:+ start:2622 stop:3752 length:1131 start_codon:yes stop_codon:yes gene_type:complete
MRVFYISGFRYSLKVWELSGALERELMYFEKLYKDYKIEHSIFTYGDFDDLNYINNESISIYPMFSIFKKTESKIITFLLSIIYPFKMRKKLKNNIDIIKVNQLTGAWVGIILSIILKKPLYIRTGYDQYLFSIKDGKNVFKRLFFYFLTYIALIFCDIYSVTSKSDYEFITNKYRFNKSKLIYRPNWVPVNNSFNSKKRNKKAILSVGRLEEQKNYKFLIDEVKNTNFSIEIIGDGSLEETLMSYAKENGVDLKILSKKNYLGLLEKYNDYQYFVLPSFYEGNPKVLIEAMSKGCIVLASNISNHTEIIKNNNNGIIFDLNKGSLKNSLERLDTNIELRKIIALNAYKEANSKFSIDKAVMSEYEDYKLVSGIGS